MLDRRRIIYVIAFATMALSLVPAARLGMDWWSFRTYMAEFPELSRGSAESFDWVVWEESDGQIVANYVFPRGSADRGGLQEGDRFFLLGYRQFFAVDDLRDAIRGARPGETRIYLVERDGAYVEVPVTLTRDPTFLYPRSSALWYYALWGFGLGTLAHLLALLIVVPLASHARESRSELLLIAVSAAWIFGTFLRLLLITLFGPPEPGGAFDVLVQVATGVGLVGWVGFPVLLLDSALCDALDRASRPPWMRTAVFVPPAVLAVGIVSTVVAEHLGPLTLEGLLIPILFYAACYIAASAMVGLAAHRAGGTGSDSFSGNWGRVGAAFIAALSLLAALSVIGVVPVVLGLGERAAAWSIVSVQLLAVVPVTLFSLGTLRHGKVDRVLTRSLVTVGTLSLLFLGVSGGASLMQEWISGHGGTGWALLGLYVVVLVVLLELGARRVRGLADSVFRSSRARARDLLDQFQEELQGLVTPESVAHRSVEVVAEAMEARFVSIVMRIDPRSDEWITASHHPEPPYITDRTFRTLWPDFESKSEIWAVDPELDRRDLPESAERELRAHGASLVIPIRGAGALMGLFVLAPRRGAGSVYNLEDLDLLLSLAHRIALSGTRLLLVDRERELARQASEAQLVALRSQINPHFLFNALNTIAAHIDTRPDDAESAVEHLAAMFRHTLQTRHHSFVSLEQELELVRHYLAVEKARFGDDLIVEMDCEPAARSRSLPAFTVQTLVENAVKHGIERKRGGGRVSIRATIEENDQVQILVSDSGVGIPALFVKDSNQFFEFFGIGLNNISERLRLLYGQDDLLSFSSSPETGTCVRLTLPVSPPEASLTQP